MTEPQHSETLKTTLGRAWKIKTMIFTVVLFGLGIWGAYDAFILYPDRGRAHADFMLQAYLERADEDFALSRADVKDPVTEFDRLREIDAELLTPIDEARLRWLLSLSRIESLAALRDANLAAIDAGDVPVDSETMFSDPRARLDEITQANQGRPVPNPLAAYDIPLQYAFLIVGVGGGIAMLVFASRVARLTYRFDPQARRLTLPGGAAITPDDVEEVDKRKWDKFLVFLKLKGAEGETRLDLYRYHPLEAWVLELEALSPGYEAPDDEGETVLGADVRDGVPRRYTLGPGDAFPLSPAPGQPASIFPIRQTASGDWLVVGRTARAALAGAAGALGDVRVNPETFVVSVAEHDPEAIETVDRRPSEGAEAAPAPSE